MLFPRPKGKVWYVNNCFYFFRFFPAPGPGTLRGDVESREYQPLDYSRVALSHHLNRETPTPHRSEVAVLSGSQRGN